MKRKEFELAEEYQATLEENSDIDERLVRVLSIWSREFGSGKQVQVGGPKWQDFRKAKVVRNHLTHPRSARDLQVTLEDMDTLLSAHTWFQDVTGLIYLSEEWAHKARDLEEAVSSE